MATSLTKVRAFFGQHGWTVLWSLLGCALVWRTGMRDRGVIIDHLEFGRRVIHGLDLYAPYLEAKPLHAPYPPSFGLLTGPFSLLPERLARFAWGFTQILAIFMIARRLRDLAREFTPHVLSRLNLAFAFIAVLAGRYILRDTHGGGGNLINLALILSALHAARFHRETNAGLILGFSLATKPVAVLFIPYLWLLGYRRAARTALFAAAGFLLLAILLLRQGVDPFLTWFDGSVNYSGMTDLFATPSHGFPPFTWMNQCLRCCVARYLGEVPAEFAALVPGFRPGLGWTPTTTAWIARVSSLVLVGTTFGFVWIHRKSPSARPYGIAAVLALSLLLSPISWKAHHVALLPAFFLLATHAFRRRPIAWILASLYVLFCGLGEEVVGKGFKEVQQAYYFTTFGTLALLAWSLRQSAAVPLPSAQAHR